MARKLRVCLEIIALVICVTMIVSAPPIIGAAGDVTTRRPRTIEAEAIILSNSSGDQVYIYVGDHGVLTLHDGINKFTILEWELARDEYGS